LEKAKVNDKDGEYGVTPCIDPVDLTEKVPPSLPCLATVVEIEELKKEAAAFREVRKGLGEEEGAKRAFEKVSASAPQSRVDSSSMSRCWP